MSSFPADHVNEKGLRYYDELIDNLLENKITPIINHLVVHTYKK